MVLAYAVVRVNLQWVRIPPGPELVRGHRLMYQLWKNPPTQYSIDDQPWPFLSASVRDLRVCLLLQCGINLSHLPKLEPLHSGRQNRLLYDQGARSSQLGLV